MLVLFDKERTVTQLLSMVFDAASTFPMSAKVDARCPDEGSTSNRWSPLSYPSVSIFSSMPSRDCGNESEQSAARVANPFFPLHRDVLLAAMRELLIVDGKIDYRNMEIISPRDLTSAHLSDDDGNDDESPSLKKRRIRNPSIDSLPTLHEQKERDCSQPHLVPNVEHFDYTRFRNAEDLVSYVVNQAITHDAVAGPRLSIEHGIAPAASVQTTEKPRSVESLPTSKRKVSDAEDLDKDYGINLDFPSEIVSLVRSNIMLLQITPSETALTKLAGHPSTEFHNSNAADNSDDSILSFLRNPKSHREQQDKARQTRLVLPQLLEVSIDDEYSLRAKARRMTSSMVNSIPGNDMNTSLRIFLGYRSSKTPARERIVDIVSDVLFDVSHAMYAWIHTHDKLLRSQGLDIADGLNCNSMKMQIKTYLFDDRALKRIGGFEPESLLPLALGIRHCRLANISWEQYAISNEGKLAMSIHSHPQVEFPGEFNNGEETCNSRRRKRQTSGTITANNSLIELGKKRRGRRGKCIQSSRM